MATKRRKVVKKSVSRATVKQDRFRAGLVLILVAIVFGWLVGRYILAGKLPWLKSTPVSQYQLQ